MLNFSGHDLFRIDILIWEWTLPSFIETTLKWKKKMLSTKRFYLAEKGYQPQYNVMCSTCDWFPAPFFSKQKLDKQFYEISETLSQTHHPMIIAQYVMQPLYWSINEKI